MQVFLSKQCLSLTGMLRTDLGYYLRSTKKGNFYAQRSRFNVPPDGHLRFIFLCAELAQAKLHITDIKVTWKELITAVGEAGQFVAEWRVMENYIFYGKDTYNASDILNLKTKFCL